MHSIDPLYPNHIFGVLYTLLICGALGNWFAGWMVDYIYRRGKWELSRKIPAIIGFSLASIGRSSVDLRLDGHAAKPAGACLSRNF